jgi:hypothetical protein
MNLTNVATLPQRHYQTCTKCQGAVEAQAKFCGHCGYTNSAQDQFDSRVAGLALAQPLPTVPEFAFLKPQPHSLKDDQLHAELGKLEFFLKREYFFLAMHWSIFVIVSLIGLGLGWQCFNGFNGDLLEKFLVSLTPVMWINISALASLVYVKRTHKEMARLRERLTYVKFKIDYKHVLTFDVKAKPGA